MIIPTAGNAYILFFKTPPTRAEFLKRTRAQPDTYAAELMGDLYDEVFRYCIDIRREYQRYYAVEYPRFSDFTANFSHFPEKLQPKADVYYAHYKVIIRFVSFGWIYQDEEGLRLLAKLFNLTPKNL